MIVVVVWWWCLEHERVLVLLLPVAAIATPFPIVPMGESNPTLVDGGAGMFAVVDGV